MTNASGVPARVLPYDIRFDRALGRLPSGMAWCVASRPGQVGYEVQLSGKLHGAFTYSLAQALRDQAADFDNDGRISVLEAVIKSGRDIAVQEYAQTPIVSGEADRIALFSSKARNPKANREGAIRALLVGISEYSDTRLRLGGPGNDVALLTKVLETKQRRLYANAHVKQVLDAEATRNRVKEEIEAISADGKTDDLVVIYFSGHAIREDVTGKGENPAEYALCMHGYGHRSEGGLVRQGEILSVLAATKAKQTLVVFDF
jgi:uncharacterized caspase-like protein